MKKKALILAAAVFLGFGISTVHHTEPIHANTTNHSIAVAVMKSEKDFIENYNQKVEAVRHYMFNSVKRQRRNPDDIKLSPEKIVEIASAKNFDIPLLLAQAHIESCFGMTSRARRTNSVFSIGAHDNGRNTHVYDTQDECIIDYVNIINNKYLSQYDGNVDLMLKNGNFTTKRGRCRYATNPAYEQIIRKMRNKIISQYPVLIKC